MKRRTFVRAIGAGSVGAGALVGTSGYSKIRSQRRVKLEVKNGVPVGEGRGISFVAFCPNVDGLEVDFEVTLVDEDGDAIELEWESSVAFSGEIIVKAGGEWWLFLVENETGGTIGTTGAGELLCDDCPNEVVDEDTGQIRCPRSPCLGERGLKYEAETEFEASEETQETCPSESS